MIKFGNLVVFRHDIASFMAVLGMIEVVRFSLGVLNLGILE
ncbi:MAG: hypothetical protein ABJN11_05800 [Lentilitoribacter sp.]